MSGYKKLTENLIEILEKPISAMVYGIESRELSHNAFLDWLISKNFNKQFVKVLAQEVIKDKFLKNSVRKKWKLLFNTDIINCNTIFNKSIGKGGRPDEQILVKIRNGEVFIIVIEIKVESSGGKEQLSKYIGDLKSSSKIKFDNILGILFLLPGFLEDNMEFPVINIRQLINIINKLNLIESYNLLPRPNKWIVEDYISLLKYLEIRDKVAIKCGEWFRVNYNDFSNGLLKQWFERNEIWIKKRILSEISLDKSILDYIIPCGVYSDRGNNVMADFYISHLDKIRRGAQIIFKWKIGVGFEVHAVTIPYNDAEYKSLTNKDKEQIRKIKNSLVSEVRNLFKGNDFIYSYRGHGDSQMILRKKEETWSLKFINKLCNEYIKHMYTNLKEKCLTYKLL